MPSASSKWPNYTRENAKASLDTQGSKLSFEALLSPTVQFDVAGDFSDNSGVDDEFTYKLSFIYPPREHKKTLQDGFIANAAFEKENVEKKLKDKVRRSNNLVVEIQGAVIVTSK